MVFNNNPDSYTDSQLTTRAARTRGGIPSIFPPWCPHRLSPSPRQPFTCWLCFLPLTGAVGPSPPVHLVEPAAPSHPVSPSRCAALDNVALFLPPAPPMANSALVFLLTPSDLSLSLLPSPLGDRLPSKPDSHRHTVGLWGLCHQPRLLSWLWI